MSEGFVKLKRSEAGTRRGDCVRAGAEAMRRRHEPLYAGQWITVIEPPETPVFLSTKTMD